MDENPEFLSLDPYCNWMDKMAPATINKHKDLPRITEQIKKDLSMDLLPLYYDNYESKLIDALIQLISNGGTNVTSDTLKTMLDQQPVEAPPAGGKRSRRKRRKISKKKKTSRIKKKKTRKRVKTHKR